MALLTDIQGVKHSQEIKILFNILETARETRNFQDHNHSQVYISLKICTFVTSSVASDGVRLVSLCS